MHFTIVFESPESIDYSYSLCFTPCATWVKGDRLILNLHPENPHYNIGDLDQLIKKENIKPSGNTIIIIIQNTGHGDVNDLENLETEIINSGYTPKTIRF